MRPSSYNTPHDGPTNWSMLRRLWPFLTEFRTRVALALACLIAAKGASVALPFLLKHTVDGLDKHTTGVTVSWVILSFIIAYGITRFANVLFGELRDTLFGRVTERAMRRVGLKVFNHLHQLDLDFHLNRQTGGLSRDIERGTSGISFLMRFMVFNIVPTLLEISMVAVLLLINYGISFALIIVVSVVLYVAFSVYATHWRTRFVREMNSADSSSNTRAIDSLLNYETVKYFNNEEYEAELYDRSLADWELARRKNRLSLFALNAGQALIIALSMTSMLLLAAQQVGAGKMTLGDFVLVNAFTMQIFMPLNFLGFVYREMRSAMANIENLFQLLDQPLRIRDTQDAQPLKLIAGNIQFKHVAFHYTPEVKVLTDLNFTVKAGQRIAIVGPSGAGKSTIMKLLLRFYDPIDGQVMIDNQDISKVTQHSLRQHISVVPQDTVLFNDTLFNNVLYGRPDASIQEVEQAIDLANLRNFVDSLPDKVNTKVGERGLKLSGGEKQRVSIARAILKNTPILLFDEATSSLDSQSEQAIMKAIRQVSQNHTSIMIAHRLSTVVDADAIFVINHGKVCEFGNHYELLAQDGEYAHLWRNQQREQRDA